MATHIGQEGDGATVPTRHTRGRHLHTNATNMKQNNWGSTRNQRTMSRPDVVPLNCTTESATAPREDTVLELKVGVKAGEATLTPLAYHTMELEHAASTSAAPFWSKSTQVT